MSRIFNISTPILFIVLLLESFFYPGFCQKHFSFNPYSLLSFFVIFFFIFSFWKKIKIHESIKNINNKFLLPALVILFLISLVIEAHTYPNFIFSHLHFHYVILIDLIALSISILYLSKTPKELNKKIFYLIPPILLSIFSLLNKNHGDLLNTFLTEDGLAEYSQFIFYITASVFFYKASTKNKAINKKILIFLCIAFILIAGEEISWGQRIFNLKTPSSIENVNVQKEITIHNLDFIHNNLLHRAYMLVGFFGAFAQILLKKFFPKSKLIVFAPPSYLRFGFLYVLLYYLSHDIKVLSIFSAYLSVHLVTLQELAELFLSIAIAGHAIYLYKYFKSSPHRNIAKT